MRTSINDKHPLRINDRLLDENELALLQAFLKLWSNGLRVVFEGSDDPRLFLPSLDVFFGRWNLSESLRRHVKDLLRWEDEIASRSVRPGGE